MSQALIDRLAMAIWANQEVWILPVSDRRNWEDMNEDAKRQYVGGVKTLLYVLKEYLVSEELSEIIDKKLNDKSDTAYMPDDVLLVLAEHLEELRNECVPVF